MQIKTRANSGFTLVEIMIVVAIIGLLASIAIPNFMKARTQSQATACISNLRQIEGAKTMWALEKKVSPGATPTVADLTPYMGRNAAGSYPTCPGGGDPYTPGDMATKPSCSLSGATIPHVLPD